MHPEFVHGIAAGAPVPLKGAVVLRVRLLEGKTPRDSRLGPEICVRCKIAARGTSDWHGLILGGRALDCAGRNRLGFRPAPDFHMLNTLGIKIPRCEDLSRTRKDRAYIYESRLSAVDSADCAEPGGDDRQLLRYDGDEALSLEVGDGVLIPVRRDGASACNGSLGEGVFPVDGPLEAVPGVWPTGGDEGNILVAALDGDTVLEPGSVVAEIRAGRVDTTACGCGAVETLLSSGDARSRCPDCGVAEACKRNGAPATLAGPWAGPRQ